MGLSLSCCAKANRALNDKPPYLHKSVEEEDEEPYYVRALFDFQPIDDGDLSFSRGDKLKIVNRSSSTVEGWWMAEHSVTSERGLVPSNFVIEYEESDSYQGEPWWFDVDRRSAFKQLILPGNPRGSFLIRKSKEPNMLTLSVKNFDDSSAEVDIKHYHIKLGDSCCYINDRRKFDSVNELIDHYRGQVDGLCCLLVRPCPKEPESIPFKDLEIHRSHVELISKLGEGKFGQVWKGLYKNKLNVAVKKMFHGKMEQEKFLDEARIMHRVHHRRLIQLIGVVTASEPTLIVMELLEHGDLRNFISEDQGKVIKFRDILDIAAQIADGMSYLEAKNFIHRDLRAANILYGRNNLIKIADFGLAKVLLGEAYQLSEDSKFPVRWTAPETLTYKKFSIKSDVWSYGIVLYELVTYGRQPYSGMSSHEMLQKLENGYRMPNPTSKAYRYIECPPKLYEMMLKCWEFSANDRPTFEYLKQFFDDYYTETELPYVAEDI